MVSSSVSTDFCAGAKRWRCANKYDIEKTKKKKRNENGNPRKSVHYKFTTHTETQHTHTVFHPRLRKENHRKTANKILLNVSECLLQQIFGFCNVDFAVPTLVAATVVVDIKK